MRVVLFRIMGNNGDKNVGFPYFGCPSILETPEEFIFLKWIRYFTPVIRDILIPLLTFIIILIIERIFLSEPSTNANLQLEVAWGAHGHYILPSEVQVTTDLTHCIRILEWFVTLLTLYRIVVLFLLFGCDGFHRRVGPHCRNRFPPALATNAYKTAPSHVHCCTSKVCNYSASILWNVLGVVPMYWALRPITGICFRIGLSSPYRNMNLGGLPSIVGGRRDLCDICGWWIWTVLWSQAQLRPGSCSGQRDAMSRLVVDIRQVKVSQISSSIFFFYLKHHIIVITTERVTS